MTYPTDQYAHLLVQGMGGDAETMRQGTGILTAWNPQTFENTVSHRGTEFHNLPVLNRVEALGFHVGQVILLQKRRQAKRGLWQYAILSAPLTPGEGAAAGAAATIEAVVASLLTSPSGITLVHFIMGQGVQTATVPNSQATTSTSFTDLPTPGPTVTGVQVSHSGRITVAISATILAPDDTPQMSFEVSGATTVPADQSRSLRVTPLVGIGGTFMVTVDGLNPGEHTVQAKYRSLGGDQASFADRHLSVTAY